jgi:CheY-like chemotaxis protein
MNSPRELHVLIVDDDDADAMMIEEALIGSPVVLQRATDGQAALELLAQEGSRRPDLILLDLNMPRMGGLQTLTRLKADADLTTIPVVVLTTSDASPDILASYSQHASAFVTKPMDLDAFESVVQKIRAFYAEIAELPTGR